MSKKTQRVVVLVLVLAVALTLSLIIPALSVLAAG